MLESLFQVDDARDAADYAVLALIVLLVVIGGLLAVGGLIAPFIVSSAYERQALIPAFIVAAMGVLLGFYLRMIGLTMPRDRGGLGAMILLAILGFFASAYGLPATLASLSSERGTLTFTITGHAASSRGSCAGVYVEHEGYERSKICGLRGENGTHVEVTGRMSWYGIIYTKARWLP